MLIWLWYVLYNVNIILVAVNDHPSLAENEDHLIGGINSTIKKIIARTKMF